MAIITLFLELYTLLSHHVTPVELSISGGKVWLRTNRFCATGYWLNQQHQMLSNQMPPELGAGLPFAV